MGLFTSTTEIPSPRNIHGKALAPMEAFQKDPYSFSLWLDSAIKLFKDQSPDEAINNKEIFPSALTDEQRENLQELSAELQEAEELSLDSLDYILDRLKRGKESNKNPLDFMKGDDDFHRDLIKEIIFNHIRKIPEAKRNKSLQDFLDSGSFASEVNSKGIILKPKAFTKLLHKLIRKKDQKLFTLLNRIRSANLPHHQRIKTLGAIGQYLQNKAKDSSEFDLQLAQDFAETLFALLEKEGDNASQTWIDLKSEWSNKEAPQKADSFFTAGPRNTQIIKTVRDRLEILQKEADEQKKESANPFANLFADAMAEAKKAPVQAPIPEEKIRDKNDPIEFKENLNKALGAKDLPTIQKLLEPITMYQADPDKLMAALEILHDYFISEQRDQENEFNLGLAKSFGAVFDKAGVNDALDTKEEDKLREIENHWDPLSEEDGQFLAKSFVSNLGD